MSECVGEGVAGRRHMIQRNPSADVDEDAGTHRALEDQAIELRAIGPLETSVGHQPVEKDDQCDEIKGCDRDEHQAQAKEMGRHGADKKEHHEQERGEDTKREQPPPIARKESFGSAQLPRCKCIPCEPVDPQCPEPGRQGIEERHRPPADAIAMDREQRRPAAVRPLCQDQLSAFESLALVEHVEQRANDPECLLMGHDVAWRMHVSWRIRCERTPAVMSALVDWSRVGKSNRLRVLPPEQPAEKCADRGKTGHHSHAEQLSEPFQRA